MSPERFIRIRGLGTGGVGEVSLVQDLQRGEPVVLKQLSRHVPPEIRRRFEREFTLLAELSHPGIVPHLDHGENESGDLWYTMPWMEEALPLDRWLVQTFTLVGRMPERGVVLGLLRDLTAALDHLHSRGILHRDIKPSNILVVPPGQARLIDFGLAGMLHSELTRTGAVLGTMTYLSPEQALGREAVPASDIYQLGLVLFRILTGQDAIQDALEHAARLKTHRHAVSDPREVEPRVGEALARVVLRCLEVDPEKRYPDGWTLLEALESIPESAWQGSSTAPPRLPVEPRRVPVRRWGTILAGFLILAAGIHFLTGMPALERPRVHLGHRAVEIEFQLTRPRALDLRIEEPKGIRRLHEPGSSVNPRFRLEDLTPGALVQYSVSAPGSSSPLFEGRFIAPFPPSVSQVRWRREPGRGILLLTLTQPSGVRLELKAGPQAAPLSIVDDSLSLDHVIEVTQLLPPVAMTIHVELVSLLGERTPQPAWMVIPET